jgi:D-alanyl-D-alanine carboxypeptidase
VNAEKASGSLQALLESAVAAGVPGVSAAVARADTVVWVGTAGVADIQSGAPVQSEMLFGIGSITKVLVASVVLHLIEERVLREDTKVSDVLDASFRDIPNFQHVTIGQLLNHSSGIPSWEDDPAWIRDGRGAKIVPSRVWEKTATLGYLRSHAPLAAPGEKISYSNSNYTLLGLIIEAATGADAAREVRRRALAPSGTQDIFLEGYEATPASRLTRRYHFATPEFRERAGVSDAFPEVVPGVIDVTRSNLSVEWLAGGYLTSMRDLARWGSALRRGQVVKHDSLAFMQQWRPAMPGVSVGHGLFRTDFASGPATIGHDGGVLGYSAMLFWAEGVEATIAVACNAGATHSGPVRGLSLLIRSKPMIATLAAQLANP